MWCRMGWKVTMLDSTRAALAAFACRPTVMYLQCVMQGTSVIKVSLAPWD